MIVHSLNIKHLSPVRINLQRKKTWRQFDKHIFIKVTFLISYFVDSFLELQIYFNTSSVNAYFTAILIFRVVSLDVDFVDNALCKCGVLRLVNFCVNNAVDHYKLIFTCPFIPTHCRWTMTSFFLKLAAHLHLPRIALSLPSHVENDLWSYQKIEHLYTNPTPFFAAGGPRLDNRRTIHHLLDISLISSKTPDIFPHLVWNEMQISKLNST